MKISINRGSCNSYVIGSLIIDAPVGVKFPSGIERIALTHEHCDHIAGIGELNAEVCASKFTIESITKNNENACLCNFLDMEYPKITKHRVLKEGDMLEESGITLTVIETPGHCAGALCFYSEDQRTLFSGDTVFPDFALPRTDLPTSDYEKLKKSYKKLAKLDVETIYPGHGEMVKNKEYVKKILEQL